ncbi:MAG TPA: PQQ-dependent sugar dehydrogenase, partial [Phycisphaerae bacterium]|nr:PQQ-dependent sugar dehydrogenase [Phycisphaerae bacterium]
PRGGGLQLEVETIVENANAPVDLAFAPDGRVFYTEKATGQIRIIENRSLVDDPFATLVVNHHSERGLLGITLHPGFATNHLLYVFYSRSTTDEITSGEDEIAEHRIVRFDASQNVGTGGEEILVTLPGEGPGNHNGGSIRFGPDGKLYVSLGDLANSSNSQNLDSLSGKILRYNDDGTIPDDNPFGEDSAVFASGIRNTFGIAFDSEGRLFGNENGPGNHDEVNLLLAERNYGWPEVQGFADESDEQAFASVNASYHEPLVDKTDGSVGSAGLDVIADSTYGGQFAGHVVYGEYRNQRIMRLVVGDDSNRKELEVFYAGLPSTPNGLRFAPDGILWVATANSIIRLVPTFE